MVRSNKDNGFKNITILLTAGRLPSGVLHEVGAVVDHFGLRVYLTTMQNLRLLDVREEHLDEIKQRLVAKGAILKVPGRFPMPRVCVGKDGCKLGLIDTELLSKRLVEHFTNRTQMKPKLKINVAACPASCSNAIAADIGVVATRSGYDIYVGGKGGMRPQAGRRIVRKADEDTVIEVIEKLVAFHDAKTKTKQRMAKLIDHPEFPYPDQV